MKQDGSIVPPMQDCFARACDAVALAMLNEFQRHGGNAEGLFVTFIELVGARNKQIAAECVTILEEAILTLDDEPVSS
jgi:hypothetical protein